MLNNTPSAPSRPRLTAATQGVAVTAGVTKPDSHNTVETTPSRGGFPWLVTAGVAAYTYFTEPDFHNTEETMKAINACVGVGAISALVGRVASNVIRKFSPIYTISFMLSGVKCMEFLGSKISKLDSLTTLFSGVLGSVTYASMIPMLVNIAGIYYGHQYSSDFAKDWLKEQEAEKIERIEENTQTSFFTNKDALERHDQTKHLEEVEPGVLKLGYGALTI